MDTSEQNIKMCDCPEIQELQDWGSDGDDVFVIDSDFATGTSSVGIIINFAKHSYNIWYTDALLKKHIWLPRQDQLQEMVEWEHSGKYGVVFIDYFYDWVKKTFDPQPFGDDSMTWEQLWLAFVMKEKFGKVWNGENWIKANE